MVEGRKDLQGKSEISVFRQLFAQASAGKLHGFLPRLSGLKRDRGGRMQQAVAVAEHQSVGEPTAMGEDEAQSGGIRRHLEDQLAEDGGVRRHGGRERNALKAGHLIPAAILRVDQIGLESFLRQPFLGRAVGDTDEDAQNAFTIPGEISRHRFGLNYGKAQPAHALWLPGEDGARMSGEGDSEKDDEIEEPYSGDPAEMAACRAAFLPAKGEGDSESADEGPPRQHQRQPGPAYPRPKHDRLKGNSW